MIQFDIITLFPAMFDSPLQESILKKAQDKGLVRVRIHNLRDYTHDRHRTADDSPYGGGAGMVMKIEPLVEAVEAVRLSGSASRVILTTPQGGLFSQAAAVRLSSCEQIVVICGRYEGVDERIIHFVDEEVSVGDYVLTGGELPAMVIIDAVSRFVPGVVGDADSVAEDSFSHSMLKYPQYTRPVSFRGLAVPPVLLSGDHAQIARWRRDEALKKTMHRRPDLIPDGGFSRNDRENTE